MSDREFTDMTADVDALLADTSHAPAIASARESLARADREWANVATQASAPTVELHPCFSRDFSRDPWYGMGLAGNGRDDDRRNPKVGWASLALDVTGWTETRTHNPKVVGLHPTPATIETARKRR